MIKTPPKNFDTMGEEKTSFGEQLLGGLTNGLTSGVSGLVGGAISGIGSMLGIGAKRQLRQQKELNEQATQLNYEYGEKAAENQYRRQMQMYERSYKDQSYAAMRKQMEDAGLNVGLMYGGGSASGGGGGATSGVPMPETGGAVAGNAASQAEMITAGTQAQMLGLQTQKLDAEIDLLKSEAERNRADAGLGNEKAETERRIRDTTIEKLRQEGIATYIQNFVQSTGLEWGKDGTHKITFRNDKNEVLQYEIGIGKDSAFNEDMCIKILKAYAEAEAATGTANAQNALAKLQDEKTKGYWTELANACMMVRIAQQNANTEALRAATDKLRQAAEQLASEWKTGEYTNWKTWVDLGFKTMDAAADWTKVGMMAKAAKQLASGKTPHTASNPEVKVKIPEIYDANGKPIAWTQFGTGQ